MNLLHALKSLYHKITGKEAVGGSIGHVVQELADNWPEAATTETAGMVKQAAHVADAVGEAPTKAEFDSLLSALQDAGIMAGG